MPQLVTSSPAAAVYNEHAALSPRADNMAADAGPGEQQYSLRWNDFHSAMLSSFRILREQEDFVDVTLACDGLSFSAHKVVLSACSPYFRNLLKANPCQHPIVILRDIHNKDMESLLRFMYHGEVHIGQDQLPDFLKAAQLLQVRGLTDVPTPGLPLKPIEQKISPKSAGSWTENTSIDGRAESRSRNRKPDNIGDEKIPPPKRARSSDLYNEQMKTRAEQLRAQERSPDRLGSNGNESLRDSFLSHNSHNNISNEGEESSSDAGISDAESDMPRKKEPIDYTDDSSNMINTNGGFMNSSRSVFPEALLSSMQGLLPGPSGIHGSDSFGAASSYRPQCPLCGRVYSSASNLRQHMLNVHSHTDKEHWLTCHHCGKKCKTKHYLINHQLQAHGSRSRAHDLLRVRATDPRPCPQCGKIYRSAHTLRTHLEDKHTVCSGYRCVLCGTVAKSRNSLHSHMSRQHRGISTKDLPVLPMPSPFNPELASKLLAKAGIKVSPEELRARASPTSGRRPDFKLDVKSATSETSSLAGDHDDYHDPASPPNFNHLVNTTITKVPAVKAIAAKTVENVARTLGGRHDSRHDARPDVAALGSSAFLDYVLQTTIALGLSPDGRKNAALQHNFAPNMGPFGYEPPGSPHSDIKSPSDYSQQGRYDDAPLDLGKKDDDRPRSPQNMETSEQAADLSKPMEEPEAERT